MKQKFEEILTGLGYEFWEDGMNKNTCLYKNDLIELMEFAFNLGLDVAADNAEADCTILAGDTAKEFIECYVLRGSILKHKL